MAWRGAAGAQWAQIAPHLPRRKANPRDGRPPADDRKCFDGILWILVDGSALEGAAPGVRQPGDLLAPAAPAGRRRHHPRAVARLPGAVERPEQGPLGLHLDSASPSERKLLEATLNTVAVRRAHHPGPPRCYPDRLIADRGYGSVARQAHR